MKRIVLAAVLLLSLANLVMAQDEAQPQLGAITNFGPNLAEDCPQPEGIAVDPEGNLYLSSLSIGISAEGLSFADEVNICVLDSQGNLVKTIPVQAGEVGSIALTGMLYVPDEGLYVTDAGDGFANLETDQGRLLRIDPVTDAVEVVAMGFTGPNAIARDSAGLLYVADGEQGIVYRVNSDGSGMEVWVEDALLAPTPGFFLGANGLAFDADESFLYVTNPGYRRILRIAIEADGSAGEVTIFADGAEIDAETGSVNALNGADGIQIDTAGYLYVTSDWISELQILSPEGELVGRYNGYQFDAFYNPASLVFSGSRLFISNIDFFSAVPGTSSKVSVVEVSAEGLPIIR
ncbi:MAG: SMP-30/gluconolactonase/LRE family protein [bacterium]|nr:SMP-30/gluconolactonase/LRE family protein [bacterium]